MTAADLGDPVAAFTRPAGPPSGGLFAPGLVADLEPRSARYFHAAVKTGTSIAEAVSLRMRGQIRLGRWLPFTAHEVLHPHRGFLWRARIGGGLIIGSDRYVAGEGAMEWKLVGIFPALRAGGPDLARSAAGRAGAEAIWLPTALLPVQGVRWSDEPNGARARFLVDGVPIDLRMELDDEGLVRSFSLDRWGDPRRTGRWGWHEFGGQVTGYRTFGGVSIPSAGRVGWYYGTDRWAEGEFFRFDIDHVTPLGTSSA